MCCILAAKAALRRKKTLQAEQDRLTGQKFTLEAQVRPVPPNNERVVSPDHAPMIPLRIWPGHI